MLAPGIVLIRDYPHASAETWAFQAEVAAELGALYEPYVVVLDVSEAKGRPKGRHLETIRSTWRDVLKPAYVAAVQPGSVLMRSVLRFILATLTRKCSVHATLEEALVVAKSALAEAQSA